MKAKDDATAVIDSTLAGGPRVLHIGVEPSTVPRRLAQEHDREVECLRWPLEPGADEQWGPEVDLADRADEWVQPFLVAPVDVVVVEGVLDEGPAPDAFLRTLGSGALVPGGLVVVSGARDLATPLQSAGFTLESEAATEDGRHVTVARFPSFTTARPQSPEADEASAAECRRLAHELERTRELLGRERATIAREMQLGKDELLAMDRQVAELQDRPPAPAPQERPAPGPRRPGGTRARPRRGPRRGARGGAVPHPRLAGRPHGRGGRRAGTAQAVPVTVTDLDEQSALDRRRAAYRQLVDGELASGDGDRYTFLVRSVDLRNPGPDLVAAAGLGLALVERGHGVRLVPQHRWHLGGSDRRLGRGDARGGPVAGAGRRLEGRVGPQQHRRVGRPWTTSWPSTGCSPGPRSARATLLRRDAAGDRRAAHRGRRRAVRARQPTRARRSSASACTSTAGAPSSR